MDDTGKLTKLAIIQVKRQLGKFRFNTYDEKTGRHKKEPYRTMGERISQHSNNSLLVSRSLGLSKMQEFWQDILRKSV